MTTHRVRTLRELHNASTEALRHARAVQQNRLARLADTPGDEASRTEFNLANAEVVRWTAEVETLNAALAAAERHDATDAEVARRKRARDLAKRATQLADKRAKQVIEIETALASLAKAVADYRSSSQVIAQTVSDFIEAASGDDAGAMIELSHELVAAAEGSTPEFAASLGSQLRAALQGLNLWRAIEFEDRGYAGVMRSTTIEAVARLTNHLHRSIQRATPTEGVVHA